MITIEHGDESIPIGNLQDIALFKIYVYEEEGLELDNIKNIHELPLYGEPDDVYNNIITTKPENFKEGIINASSLLKDLAKLSGELAERPKEIVNILRDICIKVIETDKDAKII